MDNVRQLPRGLMRNDSVKKRFSFKILAGAITAALGLVTVSLVTRALGPALLGKFDFLRAQFTAVVNFLDTGSSQAFYTHNSRHDRYEDARATIVFYRFFVGGVSLLVILGTWLAIALNWSDTFWPEISEAHDLLLGALLALAIWVFTIVTGFGDSKGQTLGVEIIKVAVRIVGVGVLFAMYFLQAITLSSYLIFSIALVLAPALLSWWFYRRQAVLVARGPVTRQELRTAGRFFLSFCSPMFIFAAFGLVHELLDRWLLQRYAGSVEQGYFALGFRFAAICMLVIAAINPLFMREFSRAHGEDRRGDMRILYVRHLRAIFFLVAALAVFFAFHSNELLFLLGGKEYQAASWAFFLMALSPLANVYGQLNGSACYATERTRTYRNVGVAMMVVGLAVSYFLIAPAGNLLPGLGLGAMGLSMKKLATEWVGVNLLAYFNCRFLGLSYGKLLRHQAVVLVALAAPLWGLRGGVMMSAVTDLAAADLWIRTVGVGVGYGVWVVTLMFLFPSLVGGDRAELVRMAGRVLWWRKRRDQ